MKPKIFVTRMLPEAALSKLREHCEITVNPDDKILEKKDIIKGVQGQDALLCLLTDTIDKDIFEAGNKLKVISNYAVGFNNIDIKEANKRSIPVCITPGILTEATADLAFALLLGIARRIVESDRYTREGKFKSWSPNLFLGAELQGKTLGIIGMGRIGQAMLRRGLGFNMSVIFTSKHPKEILGAKAVSLQTLLETADFISIHTPLTPETQHLIGKSELALMKPTAYLINTARGPVVDEKALLYALQNNMIAGAGLDVYENEPKLTPGLTALNNVILLPHIGSATTETREKMAILAVDNAIAILKGQRPYAIANPEVLGKQG